MGGGPPGVFGAFGGGTNSEPDWNESEDPTGVFVSAGTWHSLLMCDLGIKNPVSDSLRMTVGMPIRIRTSFTPHEVYSHSIEIELKQMKLN
jgi:hypothetical protein